MRALKHTIFVVLVILLLKIVRVALDRYSPATAEFHSQLLYVMQVVILSGLLVDFLLVLMRRKLPFWSVLVAWILFVMLCDLVFFWALNQPRIIPQYTKKAFRDFYTAVERNIVQFEPVTQYDSASFYNFVPDTAFKFRNIEFDNLFVTNSKGFRDDEQSLNAPEIIFLGDSYTLGWGVNQNECFPQVIESMSGKRVLNGGMSSFGTAREMSRLLTCDRSRLKYVVIQYCKNDVGENLVFDKNGDSLHISTKEDFESARTAYNLLKAYYPGKYAVNIMINLAREKVRKALGLRNTKYYISEDPEKCAEYFMKVLSHYKEQLQNVRIIVIDINPLQDLNSRFIRAVNDLLKADRYADFRENVRAIDLSETLCDDDYYELDIHLTQAGHHKLAKKLVQYINE